MSKINQFAATLEEFMEFSQKGNIFPLYYEILGDCETPVSAFRKISSGGNEFLFESVEGGNKWSRYSFIGIDPELVFLSKNNDVHIVRNGKTENKTAESPLKLLEEIMADYSYIPYGDLPIFCGGAVGYIGYDMVRHIEKLPENSKDDLGLPDSYLFIAKKLLIFDSLKQTIKILCNIEFDEGSDLNVLYENAQREILAILEKLKLPVKRSKPKAKENKTSEFTSSFEKEDFKKAVEKCREYIKDGDLLQVVLAQRLCFDITFNSFNIYRALRLINPSPYMFYLRAGEVEIVGSSPEILVRLEEDNATVRPIAGTRPRGKTEEEDKELETELLLDKKELAEHVMLVDLGRNDIGRVCETNSIHVTEYQAIERYSHVMHIVSNVTGKLKKGKTSFDVLKATFPAGTVSGAPKVRAMEIIDELEPVKRYIYSGCVGYFDFSGNMDMAISIRTLYIHKNKGYLGVGAGIVYDSIPESEYQETMNKGRALIKAIELAGNIDD
ncbi:MAG: anthranilate synthase component I [Nitrospinae bacterium]|nr:anthranilate synthase component I [Nitrospinota bacterium]